MEPDSQLLSDLDRLALDVLSGGAPRQLAGSLDELLDLDFRGHPMAGLLVGAACHDVYRGDPRAQRLVEGAWDVLSRHGDESALGLAANVRANLAFGRGDVEAAIGWWRRCLELLDEEVPLTGAALAHLSFEEYCAGDLREAIRRAEQSLVRQREEDGADGADELVSLVYLSLYLLVAGRFGEAEALLSSAASLWDRVRAAGVRNDGPFLNALIGVLAALRGERAGADLAFSHSIRLAEELHTPWYGVMARTLRAEFTAPWASSRSVDDARWARLQAQLIGDEWWTGLAVLSRGHAAREQGEHEVALDAFADADERLVNPLDRARAWLGSGETHLAAGDRRAARGRLVQAFEVFDGAGAGYWTVRTCSALALAERDRGGEWRALAKRAAGPDRVYEGLLAESVVAMRIVLDGRPGVFIDDERVRFITRHAEVSVYLLAMAGRSGIACDRLAQVLWPKAPPARRAPRLRTLLWQVRNSLGSQAWRIERCDGRLLLDLQGVELRHDSRRGPSPFELIVGWRADDALRLLDREAGAPES